MELATKKITIIPKKEQIKVDETTGIKIKKKVCAYARVSTDLEDQKNSFNAQLEEYSSRIKRNPEWEFVGLYSDEGISGTSIKKRKGFKKMIEDALAGKIDLILVKSISRFARNTIDCLSEVRRLREKGIIVQFEKEQINTLDPKVEMMLTIFASMAQEESKSISENVKWGVRSRMKRGARKVNFSTTLGYDTDTNGNVVIVDDEAKVVKEIFTLFCSGYSYREIIEYLTEKGQKTGTGKQYWNVGDIQRILTNEKYCGDVLMQKTVVVDFLTHKSIRNNGIEPQVYIEGHHAPIIDKEMYEFAKTIREHRHKTTDYASRKNINPLAGLVYCSCCGRKLDSITTHPGKPYAKKVMTCKHMKKDAVDFLSCNLLPIDYELSKEALRQVLNKYYTSAPLYKRLFMNTFKKTLPNFKEIKLSLNDINSTIIQLELQLKEIIKKQTLSPSKDNELEFQRIKQLLAKEKAKLESVESSEVKKINDLRTYDEIENFIDNGLILPKQLIAQVVKLIIRNNDNSLTFVLGNRASSISKKQIDEYLSLPIIDSGSVEVDGKIMQYKVINAGGNTND